MLNKVSVWGLGLPFSVILLFFIIDPLSFSFPAYWRLSFLTWVHSYDQFEAMKLLIFIGNNFYGFITNEFQNAMHAKWRSVFQWAKMGWKILEKSKRYFRTLWKILPSYFEFAPKLFHYIKQKKLFSRSDNVMEYFNCCSVDRQSSFSGFIALIGASA